MELVFPSSPARGIPRLPAEGVTAGPAAKPQAAKGILRKKTEVAAQVRQTAAFAGWNETSLTGRFRWSGLFGTGRRPPDRVQRRKGAAHASETHPAPRPRGSCRRDLPLLNRHQLFPKEWRRPAAFAGRSPFPQPFTA